jgi:predicted DNA-binding transcriptional regulator YafY
VDRIEPGLATDRRFTPRPPPDGDFAAFVARSISYTPYTHRAQVVLHATVEVAAEKMPPAAGVLEAIDESTCILRTGAYSLDMLSMYLVMIGLEFEVREPPELAARIRELAERFTRAAGCGKG